MAAGAHATSLRRVSLVAVLGLLGLFSSPGSFASFGSFRLLAGTARADELAPELPPEARSRLGAWQLHLQVLLGLEPVDSASAVAFGGSVELLWRCRIGVFASLLSAKGNAVRGTIENGQVLPAPGDRISVPVGLVFRPLGHFGLRATGGARGWVQRLAAGLGLELGVSIEHIRTSGDSATVPALHAALAADIPLWGGPVEGGVAIRLLGRLIAGPAVTLETGAVQMPAVGGQLYAGLAWTL